MAMQPIQSSMIAQGAAANSSSETGSIAVPVFRSARAVMLVHRQQHHTAQTGLHDGAAGKAGAVFNWRLLLLLWILTRFRRCSHHRGLADADLNWRRLAYGHCCFRAQVLLLQTMGTSPILGMVKHGHAAWVRFIPQCVKILAAVIGSG